MIKITNDTSTLNGALTELGETMADNLVAMGVTGADASDGLTTLAGKILDIEPSVGGLDLDTAMTLSSSSASVTVGGSIVLTAVLTASYDDETLVDVDLHGYLQGATVTFKNGSTVLGTGVTDVNGVATYTYTTSATGTLSLTGVFSGTDNFNNATSNSVSVSVTTPTPASVSLSADKSVLSYYHSESATLSATVLDSNSSPVESATVEFFKGSTSLGTASTNSSGVATKSYSATGSGDVSFTAECSSIVSETYVIEDCTYADTLTYTSDTSLDVSLPSHFKLEFDLYPKSRSTSSGGVSHYVKCSRTSSATDIWFGQGTSSGSHGIMVRPSTNNWCSSYTVLNQDNHVTVTYDGSDIVYNCNSQNKTVSNTTAFNELYGVSATTNGNLKNIKVKPLPSS